MDNNKLKKTLAQLLVVALDTTTRGNESETAFKSLKLKMQNANISGLDFVKQLAEPSDADKDFLIECGRETERQEEAERRRQSENALTTVAPFADDVGTGVNGYTWREIAGFCLDRKHCLRNSGEVRFVEGIARKLANPFFKPTPNQAPWLRDIFLRFGGKI
jgi:hypothetical protein